jgi:hypothetical protein
MTERDTPISDESIAQLNTVLNTVVWADNSDLPRLLQARA